MRKFLLALGLTLFISTPAIAYSWQMESDWNNTQLWSQGDQSPDADTHVYQYRVQNYRGNTVCVWFQLRPDSYGATVGLSKAVVKSGETVNVGWVRADHANGYNFMVQWLVVDQGQIDCP